LLLIYTVLALVLGWKFLVTQWIVLLFFGTIAFRFFYVQHQHEHGYKEWKTKREYLLASFKWSTHYDISRIGHRLTGNIWFHHIHHLGSFIPNYNLRQCYIENPILQKYVTSVTFRQSLSMMSNRLWDEKTSRMISFAEYHKNFANKKVASN
jgi:omega-6 fatty acid desaturase (delta-12 desaturase)